MTSARRKRCVGAEGTATVYRLILFFLGGVFFFRRNAPPIPPHQLSHTVIMLFIPPPQVGTVSEAYPHLIFDQLSSKLGER